MERSDTAGAGYGQDNGCEYQDPGTDVDEAPGPEPEYIDQNEKRLFALDRLCHRGGPSR